jgi:hypothetical protein
MYSSALAKEALLNRMGCLGGALSVVEFPCFALAEIGQIRRRILRLLFGVYNKKETFIASVSSWNFMEAANVVIDHLWQKWILA